MNLFSWIEIEKSKFEFFNWFLVKIILFIVDENIVTIMKSVRCKTIFQEFYRFWILMKICSFILIYLSSSCSKIFDLINVREFFFHFLKNFIWLLIFSLISKIMNNFFVVEIILILILWEIISLHYNLFVIISMSLGILISDNMNSFQFL